MNPINITDSANIVFKAIKAYEGNANAEVAEVTNKVSEFVTNNRSSISNEEQTKISTLLGRIKAGSDKAGTCKELITLITSIVKTIQEKTTISPLERTKSNESAKESTAEEKLYKHYKNLIETDPHFFCNEFGFEQLSQKHRVELAKLYATKAYNDILSQIKSLAIKDEDDRLEIAKVIIGKSSFQFSDFCLKISDFNLSEQKRFELALHIASEFPGTISREIHIFNLSDEHRTIVAKTLVQNGFWNISQHIKKYNIPNETDRIAIAKISAAQHGYMTIEYLPQYDFKSPITKVEIFFIALRSNPDEARNIMLRLHEKDYPIPPCFEEFGKAVVNMKNSSIEIWWKIFCYSCKTLGLSVDTMKTYIPNMEKLLSHHDPYIRFLLTEVLLRYGVPPAASGGVHTLLLNLLVSPLIKEAGLSSKEQELIWGILCGSEYRESSKMEKAIKGLYSLLTCSDLNTQEKGAILKHIFEKKHLVPTYDLLQMLDAIIISGNTQMLRKKASNEVDEKHSAANTTDHVMTSIDLPAIVNRIFTNMLGLESINDFSKKYVATIGKARDPLGLMVYAAKLRTLTHEHREFALQFLQKFAQTVLEGNDKYKTWRYHIDIHLETVFKGREELADKWKAGESMTVRELYQKMQHEPDVKGASANTSPIAQMPKEFDAIKYLKDRIPHLSPESFKLFEDCLYHPSNFETNQQALGEMLKKDAVQKMPKKYDPNNSQAKPIFLRKLEADLIKILNPSLSVNERIQHIEKSVMPKLINIYGPEKPIVHDMQALKKFLESEKMTEQMDHIDQSYKIEDTDAWEDMLQIGTEIMTSCQRISGDPFYNKCLLAYLGDGKDRAIVVKDKSGKIVARSIMRLLWDDTNKKPVVFQEMLYHNPGVPQKALNAIDLMFKQRAKQFKIPLVKGVCQKDNTNPYKANLQSLGSPAPFEYVDAGNLGITEGCFTIPAENILLIGNY